MDNLNEVYCPIIQSSISNFSTPLKNQVHQIPQQDKNLVQPIEGTTPPPKSIIPSGINFSQCYSPLNNNMNFFTFSNTKNNNDSSYQKTQGRNYMLQNLYTPNNIQNISEKK
jgi:hypothetical protein